jgi:ABC-type nickel/cobalt efflux system permease component RcnA
MMTTLITILTFILVAIIALWAVWPRLRDLIEQPKYDVLKQIREYEDEPGETKPPPP